MTAKQSVKAVVSAGYHCCYSSVADGKSSTPKVVHDKDKGFLRLSERKLSLSLADTPSHAPLFTES